MRKRTDLAVEAREIFTEENRGEIPGVSLRERDVSGFRVTTVEVTDEKGSEMLCKPIGKYVTIQLTGLLHREDEGFVRCAGVICEVLREMIGRETRSALVVGLGNRRITPDAVGPEVVSNILVTRHLRESAPEHFGHMSSIAAVETGVLATTGIESAATVKALCREIQPELVIAVDALVSRSLDRLCRTVQIADSGIVPGSGIGNSRSELSRETLGVPVIAVGIPTVVDAGTMAMDAAQEAGLSDEDAERLGKIRSGMIVTPKDIDESVASLARVTGYGINLALQPGLTVEDINMLLG